MRLNKKGTELSQEESRGGMKHIDLFSGIGGFSHAVDQVWQDVEHVFVEYDTFCQQVLKKHWPQSRAVLKDGKN